MYYTLQAGKPDLWSQYILVHLYSLVYHTASPTMCTQRRAVRECFNKLFCKFNGENDITYQAQAQWLFICSSTRRVGNDQVKNASLPSIDLVALEQAVSYKAPLCLTSLPGAQKSAECFQNRTLAWEHTWGLGSEYLIHASIVRVIYLEMLEVTYLPSTDWHLSGPICSTSWDSMRCIDQGNLASLNDSIHIL